MCFYGKIFCFYDSDENDESSSPRLSLLLTFSQPSGANFFSLVLLHLLKYHLTFAFICSIDDDGKEARSKHFVHILADRES